MDSRTNGQHLQEWQITLQDANASARARECRARLSDAYGQARADGVPVRFSDLARAFSRSWDVSLAELVEAGRELAYTESTHDWGSHPAAAEERAAELAVTPEQWEATRYAARAIARGEV